MSNELDWVPMFIHRLKASDAWKDFADYEFGWYWKLIVEEYDSDKPGYLPNDIAVLWQLAGARTMAYFQREGQSVLSRFSGRTADGRWIYHPVVLEVVQQQIPKLRKKTHKKKDDSLSLSPPVVAFTPTEVSRFVCEGMELSGREMVWLATDAVGVAMAKWNCDAQQAAERIVEKWREYEASPLEFKAGKTKFLSESKFLEKYESDRRGECEKHKGYGVTNSGECNGCYYAK